MWQQLLATTWLEAVAVFTGLASVYFSRREHILVYPVGLVSTLIYTYLSLKGSLLGEASVNIYYSLMSVWGWWLWSRPPGSAKPRVQISFSNRRDWLVQACFFAGSYALLWALLHWAKTSFAPGAIPVADALASASAYTGMYLMARKKVESWYWWMVTNVVSIPLYYVKGFAFTSLQFGLLFFMAIAGLVEWRRRARLHALAEIPLVHA